MNITKNNFSSIEQMSRSLGTAVEKERSYQKQTKQLSFNDILEQTQKSVQTVKFSKHANERLASRKIDLSDGQMKRLEDGTQKAREKGIQESLVCVDNYAFIVNVKNNTVITALDEKDDKIFTNIDGAVIM